MNSLYTKSSPPKTDISCVYYTYAGITWYGPLIEQIHPSIKSSSVAPDYHVHQNLHFDPGPGEYVIYSEEGEGIVVGPPKPYVKCFERMMDRATFEIERYQERLFEHPTQQSKEFEDAWRGLTIKLFLECQHIVSYTSS